MVTTSISYPSHDGSSAIRALLWEPQDVHDGLRAPRGLIQLVHGMSSMLSAMRILQRICARKVLPSVQTTTWATGSRCLAKKTWDTCPCEVVPISSLPTCTSCAVA